ncbi:dihydrofolate reductase [Fodinibacter luteus]|uniref:Dihydrofolate reductase n=1 Tax=Fodinibacter luteus TaxID=552064 RepID=A0ABP8KCM4_9MICO
MTRITIIAAVARNGVIGLDGTMPWHLPDELAHFKATTIGHPLVMGRATFESIGRVLPGRRTIVVTRDPAWHHPGVETAHSFSEALALAGPADEVFVAGGAQVYAEAMPFAHRMLLTEVDAEPEGDTWFPVWPRDEWAEETREVHGGWSRVVYERVRG